jgi:TRAP-type C4-dicarboxylate transport system substrate-binding protein
MFNTVQQMDCVRDKMWPYFQKKFLEQGYVLGAPGDVGFTYFMSKDKVDSMAALRGTKVWMWTEDPLVRAMFKRLGVSGVPLGVPNVLPALQSGRINACYGSPLAAVALQWAGQVKYMTAMPMGYAIGSTIMRKDVHDKASAADQKVEETVGINLGQIMRSTVRNDNTTAQNTMIRKGVTVVETPPAMIAEFDKAAQQVWRDLVGSVYSQAELDMVLKYRAECK